MADEGSDKKPKTVPIKDTDDMQERIAQLESENQRLRSENEQLHGRFRQLGVSFTPIDLSRVDTSMVYEFWAKTRSRQLGVSFTPIDLSRVDTSIVAHITSFIGEPRELLNLAFTCKSFGWPQPASTLNWSLMEEVARQAVCSGATNVDMRGLPQYVSGTTTWMSILNSFEHHLLDFDVLFGRDIKHIGSRTTVYAIPLRNNGIPTPPHCTALSSGYVMTSGIHCVEFDSVVNVAGMPCIGIVRPMPGLDADRYLEEGGCYYVGSHDEHSYRDFLAQRSDDWGGSNIHACEYDPANSELNWTNWGEEEGSKRGEEVGLRTSEELGPISIVLNLDEGTIAIHDCAYSVHKVLLKDGLSGPYCWYVKLTPYTTISIKRGTSQT